MRALLKRLFQKPPETLTPPPPPEESELLLKVSRTIRRQELLLESQSSLLERLESKCDEMSGRLARLEGPDERRYLAILDDLSAILRDPALGSISRDLAHRASRALEDLFGISPLANVGRRADFEAMTISATVSSAAESDVGKILEVIAQGYVDQKGQRIREAIVVVGGTPSRIIPLESEV